MAHFIGEMLCQIGLRIGISEMPMKIQQQASAPYFGIAIEIQDQQERICRGRMNWELEYRSHSRRPWEGVKARNMPSGARGCGEKTELNHQFSRMERCTWVDADGIRCIAWRHRV